MIEQRRAKRFELKLPVEVVRRNFQPASGTGVTRNLSAGGVLFTSEVDVGVGDPIEYIITFPTHSVNGGSVNLRCLGKVLRLREESSASAGRARSFVVAATLERYEFLREKP